MATVPPAEKRPRFRRRKVLLQPGYQLRVAATILMIILAYSLLLGFLIFYPLYQEFTAMASPEARLSIAHQILELHKRLWPSVLVVGLLVALQSIFVTQRVVGPALRLQQVLEEFIAGRYETRLELRRGDRLRELETAVNALGDTLLRRDTAQRARETRLRAAVAALRMGNTAATLPVKVQDALAEIQGIAADLGEPK